MSRCSDNPVLGRIGCGAEFKGRDQHSVARVDWSRHADGISHETFASEEACDMCWADGRMRDPRTLVHAKTGEPLLELDEKGRWRRARKPRIATAQPQNSGETGES